MPLMGLNWRNAIENAIEDEERQKSYFVEFSSYVHQ
jgi:hypothetical protein